MSYNGDDFQNSTFAWMFLAGTISAAIMLFAFYKIVRAIINMVMR